MSDMIKALTRRQVYEALYAQPMTNISASTRTRRVRTETYQGNGERGRLV